MRTFRFAATQTPMALGAQLPIRLDPETDRRLTRAAELAGTSKSAIIRMLAKSFVDQCVREDGSVTLPPQWHELLPPRDSRSRHSASATINVHSNSGTVSQTFTQGAPSSHAPSGKRSGATKGRSKSKKKNK